MREDEAGPLIMIEKLVESGRSNACPSCLMLLSALSIQRSSIVVCFLSTTISSCRCMVEVGLLSVTSSPGLPNAGSRGAGMHDGESFMTGDSGWMILRFLCCWQETRDENETVFRGSGMGGSHACGHFGAGFAF